MAAKMMRAVRMTPGTTMANPLDLRLGEWPVPMLKPGEVLVKNHVAGLNFIETYHRSGLYANPTGLLGIEGAGTCVDAFDQADAAFVGRRVAYVMANGAYAEYTAVPSTKCVELPAAVSFERAVELMMGGLTAHYLAECGRVTRDSWVLIQAAGSGTGNLLSQVCSRVLGANVVGTASTSKLNNGLERGGAKHMIDYSGDKTDLAAKVRALTPEGRGFDASFDGVGRDTWECSLTALRPRGTCVLFGNASGPVPPIDPLILTARGSLVLTRPKLADFVSTPEEFARRVSDVFSWEARGLIWAESDREFPLEKVGEAHAYMEAGKTKGKVLIRIANE